MCKKKPKKKLTKTEQRYNYLIGKGKEFAEYLRKNKTKWEASLYKILKEEGLHFQFQVPIICNKRNLYIADFLFGNNIILEIDGKHHYTKDGEKKDNLRTKRLRKEGYRVYRLSNTQISIIPREDLLKIIKTFISNGVHNI